LLKKILIPFLIIIFFSSCTYKEEKKLKISISNWIGYTPLIYAKEKKWLDDLNIKILQVSSLTENLYLYEAGNSDAFVGTQYEYNLAKKSQNSLIPLILLNRSNGGDMIMSNLTIEELKNSSKLDVYLEIDSVNSILLEDFLVTNNLKNLKINYINKDQQYISTLKKKNLKEPTLIVTYSPYYKVLEENGINIIASTADKLRLLIVDALFVSKEVYTENEKKFQKLKILIDKAIENLQENPKEYFETVKTHNLNMTYDEFLSTVEKIVWINKKIEQVYIDKLNYQNFPVRDILK
jgi:NitT/TauT family transport system substrate-binding protein